MVVIPLKGEYVSQLHTLLCRLWFQSDQFLEGGNCRIVFSRESLGGGNLSQKQYGVVRFFQPVIEDFYGLVELSLGCVRSGEPGYRTRVPSFAEFAKDVLGLVELLF